MIKSKDRHKYLTKREHRIRLKLYSKGYNDAQIGRKIGKTKEAICLWRKSIKLRSNNPVTTQSVLNKRFKRWKKGWTDRAIADAEGCPVMNVVVWRARHGYEPN